MFFAFCLAVSAAVAPVERTVELKEITGFTTPVALRVVLQPEHAGQMDRIIDAARETLNLYGEWLFPYPAHHLEIVDGDGDTASMKGMGRVAVQPHWLSAPMSLEVETQVVRGVGSQWWGGAVEARSPDDRALIEGLNQYLQDRVLERIFDRRYQRLAHSADQVRYFHGFLPWVFKTMTLSRDTAERRRWFAGKADAPAARIALAFATLERYLGWPTVQRALAQTARQFRGRAMTQADFVAAFADAAGRDLTWFFDPVFDERAILDYAVELLSSESDGSPVCAGTPCYKTTVVVRRNGNSTFSGTSQAPVAGFESGRALPVLVNFSDGQRVIDYWDGRALSRTFEYYSPAKASSAAIDPGEMLLLDGDYHNNSRTLEQVGGSAASRWAAVWTAWLQDLLLTYAFFV